MTTPDPNHVHIDRNKVLLDGHELLLKEDGILITGYDSPNELIEVHLTLVAPRVTMSPGI